MAFALDIREKERCLVTVPWVDTIPVLSHFNEVVDPSLYAPIPDGWYIGLSDVVDSTNAIEAGRYKAVNLAGAGTISAVSNALGGDLPLFAFSGDGAHFAVSPDQASSAAEALSRVAAWAARDLDLCLRVGMISVSDVRAAGADVRVAFWHASQEVRYAMFNGGGLEWAEEQLKLGTIGLSAADPHEEPDLEHFSFVQNRGGFPRISISDSRLGLVKEASPDGENSFD